MGSVDGQWVPQGGVLPPTLFILLMNDLVSELPKGVQSALYADDLILWCSDEYATTANNRIQTALNMVVTWAEQWFVTINREKTTGRLFTLSPKTQSVRLIVDDTPLKMKDQQTYLGVTFDKRMTWKQHITSAEDEQTSTVKKTLTMSMFEDEYPSDSWVRVYTDGSATNATTKGGAGIYIKYPYGDQQSEAIPTGIHCSNYKAEEEALIHAAHSNKNKVDNTTQILTDALSVLQALTNDKLPQLEQALYTIKSLTTVLQWIPSHCGV
ncbi:unnamed protein product [Mytilus coruscus]|uniref:Reverse transcriptase domain-containing protein n=1 Tax=Mytilus coruscus TaxID=42192 RepID=A0A6J8B1D5_MYTCO|nr:unnamed protein product [Mytilus coruscus]